MPDGWDEHRSRVVDTRRTHCRIRLRGTSFRAQGAGRQRGNGGTDPNPGVDPHRTTAAVHRRTGASSDAVAPGMPPRRVPAQAHGVSNARRSAAIATRQWAHLLRCSEQMRAKMESTVQRGESYATQHFSTRLLHRYGRIRIHPNDRERGAGPMNHARWKRPSRNTNSPRATPNPRTSPRPAARSNSPWHWPRPCTTAAPNSDSPEPISPNAPRRCTHPLPLNDEGPVLMDRAFSVELPGIEPGSSAASPGLLRVQFAVSLLGSLGLANEPR